MQVYSVTDKPVRTAKENLLGIAGYADALTTFIMGAEAPLTIGMQGEWGTGKTSLMYLVRENLTEKHHVATSWVNTWEYSLFKDAHETTPAVLKGLLENLIISCKEMDCWPQNAWEENKETLTKGLKAIGSFAAKVAVNKTTGQNVEFNLDDPNSLLSEIAELKNEIKKITDTIIKSPSNPLNKIVFFVDDLDRIDPPVAVEILEALKNIFDIDNCIFVLAIDYDVVIKGLEKKFGKKTNENEREFRSFFDKIIQVPFSMPTGAYEIDTLLKNKFEGIGITLQKDEYNDYVKVVGLTVGENPRSIKRFINTFSLLKNVRSVNSGGESGHQEDFCLFTLLGIQISYPHVFRLFGRESDFRNWDMDFAESLGIEEVPQPKKDTKNKEYLDETWELILWAYCQRDPYMRTRAKSIIGALNFLYEKLDDKLNETMEMAMEFAAMTSVDESIESKSAKRRGPVRNDDEITACFETISQRVSEKLKPEHNPQKRSRWAGTDNFIRYFNFWYSNKPWGNWPLSYRIEYFNTETNTPNRDSFLVKLQFECKKLVGIGVGTDRIDALTAHFHQTKITGFTHNNNVKYPALEIVLPNDGFSEATLESVADCLSELISQTKDQVDQILSPS